MFVQNEMSNDILFIVILEFIKNFCVSRRKRNLSILMEKPLSSLIFPHRVIIARRRTREPVGLRHVMSASFVSTSVRYREQSDAVYQPSWRYADLYTRPRQFASVCISDNPLVISFFLSPLSFDFLVDRVTPSAD